MKLLVLNFLAILSGGLAQEFFIQGNRPYVVLPPASQPQNEGENIFSSGLVGRSGLADDASSEEETQSHEGERVIIKNFTSTLPTIGSTDVAKPVKVPPSSRRRKEPIRKRPNLKADPETFDASPEEDDKASAFRFLWPFQVSVSKTKGHPPIGHHGGYRGDLYNFHHKKRKYDVLTDDFKGLTPHDLKVLNSKGYKKYRKKKKKKIKKIKKKLKFKQVIQKILDKKIAYLDSLAPEYY